MLKQKELKYNKKVSIIIPVYNSEKHLERCLDSILNQTFDEYEILLIDDGSTDGSGLICDEYSKRFKHITVVHQKNSGVSVARNTGISLAKGEYLQFVDSDDFVSNNLTAELYKSAKHYNSDIVVCGVHFVAESNGNLFDKRVANITSGVYSLKEFILLFPKYMPNSLFTTSWNKLYRKSLITDNNIHYPEKLKNNEDTHFNLEVFQHCSIFSTIDSQYYNYFENVNSVSRNYIDNLFDIYTSTHEKFIDFFIKTDTYNNNICFLNEHLMNLTINALQRIVLSKNKLTFKEKLTEIKRICNNNYVTDAAKTYRNSPFKKRIVTRLIKAKQSVLIYILFYFSNLF